MNAKNMRSTKGAAFTFAIAVLALGLTPAARADDKGCTNASLNGTYSQRGTGVIVSPPALAGPMANVGTLTFDGRGGLTGTVVNSLNGNIVAGTEKGTYH